jgi:hypothetical protein
MRSGEHAQSEPEHSLRAADAPRVPRIAGACHRLPALGAHSAAEDVEVGRVILGLLGFPWVWVCPFVADSSYGVGDVVRAALMGDAHASAA